MIEKELLMLVVSPIPAGPGVLPVGYCTSEQMDLLRQVFAEVDHVAGRPAPGHSLERDPSR
jgi:hypothetical protein